MIDDLNQILAQARLTAGVPAAGAAAGGSDRQRLERVAAEFESMLLVQVLRDMRRAGRWGDEEEDDAGTQPLFETLDVELASHLARSQGFGLTAQLLKAFDRMQPSGEPGKTGEDVAPAAVHPAHDPARPTITSEFGWRRDPISGDTRFHAGVDLRAAYGQDVAAAGSGRVVFSGTQGGYGTTVLIEHADGTKTRYAHLSSALVREGDGIATGQIIGRAGQSGRATGTHVHFEVIDANGQQVDPVSRRVG